MMKHLHTHAACVFALATIALFSACRRETGDPLVDGLAALERNDYKRATLLLEKAVTLNPCDGTALANLGVSYWRRGKDDLALAYLSRAGIQVANDSRPYEYIAAIYRAQKRWGDAWNALGQANLRHPQSPRILTAMAAVDLYRKGPDNAMVWIVQALEHNPTYAPALYNAGIIARDWHKNQDKARDYFGRFVAYADTDPRSTEIKNWLEGKTDQGRSLSPPSPSTGKPTAKDSEQNALIFKKPLIRDARAAADFINRGLTAYQARDWSRAIQHFTRAVEADDSMGSAYYNLGLALRASGNATTARDMFTQALNLQPSMINARYMLALVLREMGQFDAAAIHLRQILVEEHDYPDAHLALGAIYNTTGQAELCRTHLTRYLELMPNGPAANDARRMLKMARL